MDFQVGTWTGLKRRLVPMRAINYLTRVCSRLVQMKIKWLSHLRSLTRRRPLNIDMRGGGGSTPRKNINEIHLVVFGKFARCCHSSTRFRAFLQRSRNFQLLLTCLFHFAHQSQEVNIYILSIDLFNTLSREFYFFCGRNCARCRLSIYAERGDHSPRMCHSKYSISPHIVFENGRLTSSLKKRKL